MGPCFLNAFKVKKARESGFSFLMEEGSSISLSYGSISLFSQPGRSGKENR